MANIGGSQESSSGDVLSRIPSGLSFSRLDQVPEKILKPVDIVEKKVKLVAMVKPFKRESPGKDSPSKTIKSSPHKKIKLSDYPFEADVVSLVPQPTFKVRWGPCLDVVDNPPKELSKEDNIVGEVLPDPEPTKAVEGHNKNKKVETKNLIPSKIETKKAVDSDASKTDVSQTEPAGTTKISENQCEDCKKIMKTPKSLIDHKKKFRCPGKTEIDEDLKAKNILPGEHTLEEAAENEGSNNRETTRPE